MVKERFKKNVDQFKLKESDVICQDITHLGKLECFQQKREKLCIQQSHKSSRIVQRNLKILIYKVMSNSKKKPEA